MYEQLNTIINYVYNFILYWYVKANTYIKELTDNYPNIHLFLRNRLLSEKCTHFLKNHYSIQITDILFQDIETENLFDKEVKYLEENKNSIDYDDNYEIDKDKYSLLEGIIIELCKNDMEKRDMKLDLNTQTIEYWINKNHYKCHYDCDSKLLKQQCILHQGIHNGIIYMTDSDEPTYISEYNNEDQILNKINNIDGTFFLHFPRRLNHLSFNGKCFHGAVKMYENKDIDRIIVAYNVWENTNKPKMIKSILKKNDVNMENHKYAFMECNNILEHSIYLKPDHNEIINKKNSECIKYYINYVLEQKKKYTRILNNCNFHVFSSPYSRIESYDSMGKIYLEHKNIINNDKKETDNILWQRIIHPKVVDIDFCNNLIKEAEMSAENKEWPLIHSSYKSNSIKADVLKSFTNILSMFEKNIMPLLFKTYQCNLNWNILDIFINKYDMTDNSKGLSSHIDQGDITINILLNDENEFEEGGTKFIENEEIIKLRQGDALFHCGKDHHEGVNITSGKRYIMVIFLEIVRHL